MQHVLRESTSTDGERPSSEISEDDPVRPSRANSSANSIGGVITLEASFIRKKHCKNVKKQHFGSNNPLNSNRSEAIATGIAKMIAVDMLPLCFSENRGFVEFMDVVLPGYNIPEKTAIENRIEKMYKNTKEKVITTLKAVSSVALTTDAWSSKAAQSYITVTAHMLNDNWKLVTFNLETLEFEDRQTAVNLTGYLEEMAKRWSLDGKIVAVVHDNVYNVTAAVRGSEPTGASVPCFAHTLQCAVNAGLADDGIEKLIEKATSIVGHFKHSYLTTAGLSNQQRQLGLPKHRLIQSCRTRWNSTYAMFERLLEQRIAVCAVMDDQSPLAKIAHKLKLNDPEWEDMRQLCKLLKPFDRATTVMSAENGVTLSMTRPLIHSLLKNFLKPSSTDGILAANFKAVTEGELRRRFLMATCKDADCGTVHVAQFAMILDPRYKGMLGEEEDDKIMVTEKLSDILDRNNATSEVHSREPSLTKPTALDFLFMGEVTSELEEMSTSVQTDELHRYLAEADSDHNYDPLRWWRDNEARYPMIADTAKKYLGIPATSIPAERVFSIAGNIINAKRNCLSSEHVDALIFLYQNRDYIQ